MNTVWSKADLHIHTVHSDGHATVEQVLAHAAERTDLRVIAITDHDTITGALAARQMAASYGIEVIVGEEISTADGHLLALFIERHVRPGQPAAATIAAVHAQGGLCFAAHPYDWMVPSMGRGGLRARCVGPEREWPLDGIETFNAGLWLRSNNARAAADAQALGLTACGGSDSHHCATIGAGYTLFPGRTAADLRAALVCGATRVEGRLWGLARVAEVAGLIVRRELGGLAARARRTAALGPWAEWAKPE